MINSQGDEIMFQVKIPNGDKENEYSVFKQGEFSLISDPINYIIACPSYYQLNIIPSQTPTIQYTNIEPVIINSDMIEETGFNRVYIDFGQPITLEEYEILYELYLKQMAENPDQRYLKEQKIKQDIEHAKTLVKKSKRA